MALEALANVLSDLGKRYQGKIEDEQKRQEQLADIADQRNWLEGRTANEQQFQDSQRQKHVSDTKDLQANESGLRIKEESARINAQIEGHIKEVIALAPVEQASQLVRDHIISNMDEAKDLSADTIRKLYIAKASEAATGELVNKIANQPLEFKLKNAENAPALAYLVKAKDDADQNLKELKDAAAVAEQNSDVGRVQDKLATEKMSKFQMTPALEKQIKSKVGSRAKFEAMSAMDQLNILSDIPKSGVDAMSVMMLPSQADKIAKSNQLNFAKLQQSIPGLETNTRQLQLHVANLQQYPENNISPSAPVAAPTPSFNVPNRGNTPVPSNDSAPSFFAPPTGGYQPGSESSGSNLIMNRAPVTGTNPPVSPVAMNPSAFSAPAEEAPVDNSAYFRGMTMPSAPVTAAPAPANLAPAPVVAPAPAPSPLVNNLVPAPASHVTYAAPSGDGKDGIRAQIASAQAQLQSLSSLTPGYDTNAKKAQLQSQIDGLSNLLNPKPTFFDVQSMKNSISSPVRQSNDIPNNLTMGGTA